MNDTTRRVYRYMYKVGEPVGIHELQRGLGMSSSSLAAYHIKKLLDEGLIREQDGGYVVDRIMFENMIRIRKSVIPFQTTYTIFFASTLALLLILFFPRTMTAGYLFSIFVNVAALGFFLYETIKAFREKF